MSKNHCCNPRTKSSKTNHEVEENKPRNFLVTSATSPYTFIFRQYGQRKSITVHQTAKEETWPGGALWDLGVLLSRLLVSLLHSNEIARLDSTVSQIRKCWKDKRILELGCGVGLTGLVASALGARATLLTDLEVVIDKVTLPNLLLNSRGTKTNIIKAMPLSWGNTVDEEICAKALDDMASPFHGEESPNEHKKKKKSRSALSATAISTKREGIPDILLIGDVAYQHKPGAPSHFDILLSTILRFTDEHTTLLFGTRMRMPASVDLLEMILEHFEEIVVPCIEAQEVDLAFAGSDKRHHHISIHFLKRKRSSGQKTITLSS